MKLQVFKLAGGHVGQCESPPPACPQRIAAVFYHPTIKQSSILRIHTRSCLSAVGWLMGANLTRATTSRIGPRRSLSLNLAPVFGVTFAALLSIIVSQPFPRICIRSVSNDLPRLYHVTVPLSLLDEVRLRPSGCSDPV